MGEDTIPDKNVELNGKIIGASGILRLSVKTAFWIVSTIFGAVMSILTYSYFDLKKDVNAKHNEFIIKVNESVDKMDDNIQTIRIDQATIKGDIKLILDRQTRDNPVVANPDITIESAVPPPDTNSQPVQ